MCSGVVRVEFFLLMIRRPPRSTRTDTLCPSRRSSDLAALAACHARAARPEDTDWPQIVALYDALAQVAPSPVVEFNRAVAVGSSEEHTSELQTLIPNSYAHFCLQTKTVRLLRNSSAYKFHYSPPAQSRTHILSS